MKQKVTVAHVEVMGKSAEYAKIYGVTNDPKRPAMAICICHKSNLPISAKVGCDLDAITFYGKSGLSFEPFCDTFSEEGGVTEWVKQQLS